MSSFPLTAIPIAKPTAKLTAMPDPLFVCKRFGEASRADGDDYAGEDYSGADSGAGRRRSDKFLHGMVTVGLNDLDLSSKSCQRSHWKSGHKEKCEGFRLSRNLSSSRKKERLKCPPRPSLQVAAIEEVVAPHLRVVLIKGREMDMLDIVIKKALCIFCVVVDVDESVAGCWTYGGEDSQWSGEKSGSNFSVERTRLIKRSLSVGNMLYDDNILRDRNSSIGTAQNNEESLPEISSESDSSYQRYTNTISSEEYTDSARVFYNRDSFNCSNFLDWLSSSRNSFEDETYER
ncbi:hypothetical protein M8C21_006513 [Ambrosia artemisiifolia]|uniref:Uncharacterized protein n=1 Tax=Ambrosia artemisiifolia TaxID=4212 RepID=A0AAD5GYZ7_AMBAR|nr:hypothetical protein M8C21_006513 [Ambrosia artemisiifolia]